MNSALARRTFVRLCSACAAFLAKPGPQAKAAPPSNRSLTKNRKNFVGIQVKPYAWVDEGIDQLLKEADGRLGQLPEVEGRAVFGLTGEALAEFILSRASRENPFDLIGAMFIIEGLGRRVARNWAERIRDQLGPANLLAVQLWASVYRLCLHGDSPAMSIVLEFVHYAICRMAQTPRAA